MEKIKKAWKKIKKPVMVIARVLEWAIFGLLILIFLAVLSPLLPTKKYLSTFIVASGSMQPTIKTGSVAVVQPVKYKDVKKGDIIIFTSPENPNEKVLHRVNQVVNDGANSYLITKGDNNNVPDNWKVYGIQVQDKFITSIPYLGFPAEFIKKPLGFALLIGIPALLLIILEIRQIMLGIEEEVKKRTEKILHEKKPKKKSIKTSDKLVSVILLGIMLNVLAFRGINENVHALFTATATVSGVGFSVVDFIPPSAPANLRWSDPSVACGGSTNSYTLTAVWDASTPHGSKTIDHYEYESFNPPGGWMWGPVNVSATQRAGAFTVGTGTYGFRVRAVDSLGYTSDWTSVDFATSCQITYSLPTPPAPSLLSPANNSDVNTNGLIMKWNAVTGNYNNPLYYIYQSATNPGFSPAIYTSVPLTDPQIPAPGTPEGVYWWHVKTCDSLNNCYDWSEVWQVMVDNTAPTSVIASPANNGTNSIVKSTSWDGAIAGTATDNLSGVNRVDLSINRASDNTYWNGSSWISGTEATVRVTATGTTSWTYTVSDHSTPTTYTITSHSVDNAGNIENSYVLTIVFPTPTPDVTPTPSATPEIDPTPTDDPSPTPSMIPTPTPTDTPDITPSPTDSSTDTPTSTPTQLSTSALTDSV